MFLLKNKTKTKNKKHFTTVREHLSLYSLYSFSVY